MTRNKTGAVNRQSGNAFFMILMAIVLFAALAFTFSRGMQQGGENISSRQAELAASDILSFAQKLERGVQSVLARGVSESDISFDSDADPAYDNTKCSDSPSNDDYLRCEQGKIFGPQGAKLAWSTPPQDSNNGQNYFFGVNQAGPVTETANAKSRDLVLLLPVKPRICAEINQQTTRVDAWQSVGPLNDTVKFTGDYQTPSDSRIDWPDADPKHRPAGCFCTGSSPCNPGNPHYFYYVLYAR